MKKKKMRIMIQPYMYGSGKKCQGDGNHLTSNDEDGYCRLCGYKETAKELIREEVKDWMLSALDNHVEDYIDSAGKFNCTMLAENAAYNFEHEDWLSIETHWVWDIAFEATEEHRK